MKRPRVLMHTFTAKLYLAITLPNGRIRALNDTIVALFDEKEIKLLFEDLGAL